jgi:hypothetical protein
MAAVARMTSTRSARGNLANLASDLIELDQALGMERAQQLRHVRFHSALLGIIPFHDCVDEIVHRASGLQALPNQRADRVQSEIHSGCTLQKKHLSFESAPHLVLRGPDPAIARPIRAVIVAQTKNSQASCD